MAEQTLTIQNPKAVIESAICDLAKLQVAWTDGDGYEFLDDFVDHVPHEVWTDTPVNCVGHESDVAGVTSNQIISAHDSNIVQIRENPSVAVFQAVSANDSELSITAELPDLVGHPVLWQDDEDGVSLEDEPTDFVPHGIILEDILSSGHGHATQTPELYYGLDIDATVQSSRHAIQSDIPETYGDKQLSPVDSDIGIQSEVEMLAWGIFPIQSCHSVESTARISTSTTLSVNNSNHGHQCESISLNIDRGLFLVDSNITIESGEPTLTVNASIGAINAKHKIKTGRPILLKTAESLLSVVSVQHKVNSSTSLTISAQLNSDSSEHICESITLDLSTAGLNEVTLSPLNISHNLYLTNQNLEIELSLDAADGSFGHETEKTGITLNGNLAIVDSEVALISDSIDLDRYRTLTVQNSDQASTTDSVYISIGTELDLVNPEHDFEKTQSTINRPTGVSAKDSIHKHFSRGDLNVNNRVTLVPQEAKHYLVDTVFALPDLLEIVSSEHSVGSEDVSLEYPIYPFKNFIANDSRYLYIAKLRYGANFVSRDSPYIFIAKAA